MTVSDLALLLSEGLDLCVRARQMDAGYVALKQWQTENPHVSRSATIPLWVEDQYQKDLAAWEARARKALS
jgi:hypothetical protein